MSNIRQIKKASGMQRVLDGLAHVGKLTFQSAQINMHMVEKLAQVDEQQGIIYSLLLAIAEKLDVEVPSEVVGSPTAVVDDTPDVVAGVALATTPSTPQKETPPAGE